MIVPLRFGVTFAAAIIMFKMALLLCWQKNIRTVALSIVLLLLPFLTCMSSIDLIHIRQALLLN
jgi:hypothetical protein